MSSIRTFIAIELPITLQDAIQKQTARLREVLGDKAVRWTPPHNTHVTLKFLGDIATSHLDFIKQAITQSAETCPEFNLQVGGLGSFPSIKRPRVIWIGLHAPAALATLQRNIESAVTRLGYEKEERAFSPHLTIGRIKQNTASAELQKIRAVLETIQLSEIGSAQIRSVHLFKSVLQPTGSVYTKLFSARLAPPQAQPGASFTTTRGEI